MERDNTLNEDTREVPTREADSAQPPRPPRPRGNQEPQREWVEQGEEQLEKVSGN